MFNGNFEGFFPKENAVADIIVQEGISELTHLGRDKMGNIFQTIFSNEFSWMEMIDFEYSLAEFCSSGSYWQKYVSIHNDVAPNRRQSIIWTNDGLGWWRIYASLGLNQLTY